MKSRTCAFVVVGLSIIMFSLPAAFADSITNGSFEAVQIGSPFNSANPANIPGWTHAGAIGDALLWAVGYADGGGNITVAGDGKQFVTMGNGFNAPPAVSSWSTTITDLTPGNHVLSFMIANEGGDVGAAESLTVSFTAGSSTAPQTFTAPANNQNYWKIWLPETLSYVATGTSATVVFSVNQGFDMGLDNVSSAPAAVVAPEPSTLLLLGTGLAGLVALRRRKAA
jgi:PEP-CTERM motif